MNFNIHFGDNFTSFEDLNELVLIEIQLGHQIVERNQLPMIFAKENFVQLIQQVSQDPRPIKITAFRDDYTETGKRIQNSLAFKNKAFVQSFGE